MTRKLSRLHTIIAGGAFAVAGIVGAPAAALAADHDPVVTDQVAAAAAESVGQTNAPAAEQMHPLEITAAQQRFTPSEEQLRNAKAIVDAGKAMGLTPRAWTIAVATALQESNLENLGHLGASNDHDSLGLFQQRPTSGWGTPEQIQDPTYAATAFYEALVDVDGWDGLALTVAAQKVQVSAYPNHYAKHEAQAGDIIAAVHGTGPFADLAAGIR
jgi:hypothetical protein